ncbi:MAG: DUF6364 family protein [Pseudomonadales bacterium]|jgi:hypothetical protein|nr:DUF6364 family protein [Pseudomonadales bacterium]
MKTTLDLNDALLAKAKVFAVQQQTTLTRLVEDGLKLRLEAPKTPTKRVHLPVYPGKGGLAPGVDSLSNKAMLEAIEHDA